ncbi:AAA family ATPase [Lentzea fradiae]|uniref:AAA family ATPase n=1 Tax=Lentzea fradiae TaxID=200378 RepID=UPI00115FEE7C|nr:AAA family ATPase [Lentzea fradiae]
MTFGHEVRAGRWDAVVFPRLPRVDPALASARIVAVEAPSGYGKTTFAKEFTPEHQGSPWVWYRLRQADHVPSTFLRNVFHALARRHPELTGVTFPLGDEANLDQLADLARAALARVREPVHLVLDGMHVLGPSGSMTTLLEVLAFPARTQSRLVCLSRFLIDLPWTAESSHDRFVLIGPDDLAFTPEETQQVLAANDRRVSRRVAVELTADLDGWPSAIQEIAASRRPIHVALRRLLEHRAPVLLGTKLMEDPELADFVQRTSLMRELEPAVCAHAFGPAAGALLVSAPRVNSFVLPVGRQGVRVRYHRALAIVLADMLRARVGVEGVRDAHRTIAQAWRREGDEAEAVHHLIQAGDWSEVADALRERAPRMVEQGRISEVGEWLAGLPESQLRDNPALSHIEGIVDMHSGYLTEARAAFLRARESYAREGKAAEASLSAYWLASSTLNQPIRPRSDHPVAPIDPHDQWQPFVDLCVWQSLLLANRDEEAERMRRRATEHPQAQSNLPFTAYHAAVDAVYGRRCDGDLTGALNQLQVSARLMERSDPLSRLPVVLAYGALVLWDLGRPDECREWVERGREAASERGMTKFNAGWFDLLQARLDLREGRAEQARALLGTLRRHQADGMFIWRAHQLDLLAAEIELACAGRDADLRLVETAHESALAFGYRHEITWTRAELADALAAAGHRDEAARFAALALEDCEKSNRHLATRARRHVSAPPPAPAEPAAPVAPRLDVSVLGGFTVMRDGTPMPTAAWGRRRARQLFKLLLVTGRPLHVEEITDLLWSQEKTAEAAQRGLNTAVYWLRRALEPDLGRGVDSRYVVSNSSTYQLVLPPGDTCDLVRLRQVCEGAEATREELSALFDASCRELLPSDRYEPWVESAAHELVRHRQRVGARLLDLTRRSDDPEEELRVMERCFDADPWRTELARDLMRRYNELGRHEAARLVYNRMRSAEQ